MSTKNIMGRDGRIIGSIMDAGGNKIVMGPNGETLGYLQNGQTLDANGAIVSYNSESPGLLLKDE